MAELAKVPRPDIAEARISLRNTSNAFKPYYGRAACSKPCAGPTRDTWVEIEQAVVGVLERTTLRDLAERQNEKLGVPPAPSHL